MRYLILIQMLLLSASAAFANDVRPSCKLVKESILSRSPTGIAQVSNLGSIHVMCQVPARPFPSKPGEGRYGLTAATTAFQISTDGDKTSVPSEANVAGGGSETGQESVNFYVHIPLDSEELDAEAQKYLAKLFASMTPEQKAQLAKDAEKKALENLRPLVYQHRVGHFQVTCHVLDGTRVVGTDIIELEVLFKGGFSDIGLPGSPPV
jgi:hypothetical protein